MMDYDILGCFYYMFSINSLVYLSTSFIFMARNMLNIPMYYLLHRFLPDGKADWSEVKILEQEGMIMPRGDGTGPMGQGALTGRAAGFCAGYSVPGFANGVVGGFGCGRGRGRGQSFGVGAGRGLGGGQGFGFGRGQGRGFGRGFGPMAAGWNGPAVDNAMAATAPTAEQERGILQKQAEYLEENLQEIRKRLAELEEKQAGKE